MFLILVFIHQLILRGSAYISTNIDPNYVPCFSRIETLGCMNANNMIENVILVPSNIYIAFQSIIILLSVLGNILDMIKNPIAEIIEVQGQVRNNIMEERNREEERRNLDLPSDDESDDDSLVYMGGGRWERR